jgi:hypothetical protein
MSISPPTVVNLSLPTVARGGFADVFPITALMAALQIKLGQPSLSASDWIKIGRPDMNKNADYRV